MTAGRVAAAACAAVVVLGTATGCRGGSAPGPAAARLSGEFHVAAGHCTTATARPSGSYLILVSASTGRAVPNPAGGCVNHDYTVLRPGTDGGLVIGRFQPQPTPTFDRHRNATAARIVEPVRFGRYRLGLATSPLDEQNAPDGSAAFPAPQALVRGDRLSVDLRSLVLTYGGSASSTCRTSGGLGCWNIGSLNAGGTYDRASGRAVVEWFSGESFFPKGDSLEVHLEGTVGAVPA